MKIEDKLLLDINKSIDGEGFICGGALRNYFEGTKPRDIDIFMKTDDENLFDKLCEKLFKEFSIQDIDWKALQGNLNNLGNYYSYEFFTKNNIIISIIKPQILYGRKCYGDITTLVDEIDFNVCRLGLNKDNTIYCPEPIEETIQHIKNKSLKIMTKRPEERNRTIRRLEKYQTYGYKLILN